MNVLCTTTPHRKFLHVLHYIPFILINFLGLLLIKKCFSVESNVRISSLVALKSAGRHYQCQSTREAAPFLFQLLLSAEPLSKSARDDSSITVPVPVSWFLQFQ